MPFTLPQLSTPTPSPSHSQSFIFPLPLPLHRLPTPTPTSSPHTISPCIGFPTATGVMDTVVQCAFIPAIFSCVYIVRGCGRYANPDYHVYLNAYNRATQVAGNFTHEQVCPHAATLWDKGRFHCSRHICIREGGGPQILQYKVNPNPNLTPTLIHAVHTV